uniref:Uncharacterized protein n=1 Tax=Heterorhabditis bacteriophora TaxID=37862 RepID=A0A1I7WDF7_HETBA
MKIVLKTIRYTTNRRVVRNTHCIDKECLHAGSNRRPSVYETDALPLSYKGSTVLIVIVVAVLSVNTASPKSNGLNASLGCNEQRTIDIDAIRIK